MASKEMVSQQEDFIDEYVIGIQNPSQLIGSLALLLRERNYVGLYDTSILSSPEQYLKKNSLEDLNKAFLYKWFLFFTGVYRNINKFENLIVLPEVADEICNLVNGILSAIEKRKNQFRALSPLQKEELQNIFEQLLRNEEVLHNLLGKMEEFRQRHPAIVQPIFQHLLELIKFLNTHLELKKVTSRKANDTDERIAARTFYEVFVNSYNVAVYTRDDDIRKLISTTFRLLVSRQVSEELGYVFLKNLSHLNILVLKYNYEKKSFSRFFESSTLPHTGEFRFPRKLTQHKISQIIPTVNDILYKMREEIESLKTEREEQVQESEDLEDEAVVSTLQKTFSAVHELKIYEDLENVHRKIKVLENLAVLAKVLKCPEMEEKIVLATQEHQHQCLQNLLHELKKDREDQQKLFDELSGQQQKGLEYWQKVSSAAEDIQETLLQIRFFESALRGHFYHVGFAEYELFKQLLEKFEEHGFQIDTKGTPVPIEKIAEIADKQVSEAIKTIEAYNIEGENTFAYLTQENIVFFLDLKKT